VLRIRDVYPGSDFFHPDPRSRVKKIPDSGPGSAPKKVFFIKNIVSKLVAFRKMIRDVHPGSRIRTLIFYPSLIPDPGIKNASDPGSGSATLLLGTSKPVGI
jgi:hypothetical protein